MKSTTANSRINLRFTPDPNTLAWIHEELSQVGYEGGVVGLTVNESQMGCNVVFLKNDRIKQGQAYRIIVGELAEAVAEIRWIKELDDSLIRVGFEYRI